MKGWKGCLIGCLIFSVAAILITCLTFYFGFFILRFIFEKISKKLLQSPEPLFDPLLRNQLGGILQDFFNMLTNLFERLKEFLHFSGPRMYRL